MAEASPALAAYPITYRVQPQTAGRNRLTVAFRAILAIPHGLLVGDPTEGVGGGAIVFAGRQPHGLWDFTDFYMRWRGNALAYMVLLRDEYPPFGSGDGSYPASFGVDAFPQTRNRWSVGLRLIYAIPQFIVLFFLGIAWLVTVIIGWLAILFTGRYPEGLYTFGVGYMRWSLRVEAYVLLMRDEYPPFSLD